MEDVAIESLGNRQNAPQRFGDACSRRSFAFLIPEEVLRGGVIALDLSIENPEMNELPDFSTAALSDYIFGKIRAAGARVAVGGYRERRAMYERSPLFRSGAESRSVHLGVDLWCEPGTPVFAPLHGIVHSFRDNAAFGDYGPTIILAHEIDGLRFHTLYGHLSRASLSQLQAGRAVAAGEQVGDLGTAEVNGGWPPHLHFQVILDLQGHVADYPGVASRSEEEAFAENCPDPNLLLRWPS